MKKYLFVIALAMATTWAGNAFAQMPHDAIYMNKKQICFAATYGQSTWTEYWENTLKRQNFNIGTHTTQTYMPMVAYGITENLNVIVGLPYISTKTSAGNLMGQKGLQDVSAWVKYKFVGDKLHGLSLHGAIGVSVPVSSYIPDFLPMSIGLQCNTFTGRVIGNYRHKIGLYVGGHASYSYRSNITVDRDAYQADNRVYNTNEVRVPNATDTGLRLGYYKKGRQIEVFYENFSCVGGDNIRRNDMPFPTNNMRSTMMGAYMKYQPKNLGVNARYSTVTNGLNVGQSTSISLGVLYALQMK